MRRFVVFLSIILIVLGGGTFIIWRQLPQLVSYIISKETRTHVHITAIGFGRDQIHFDTVVIDSPEGATLTHALKIEDFYINAPYTAYARDPVVIPSIQLNDIYLGIEFYDQKRSKGNWITIMQNVSKNEEKTPKKEQSDAYLQEEKGYGIINDLTMNDLKIELKLYNQNSTKLSPIPTITFKDIRTDNGELTQELTQLILKKMMYSVFIMKGIQTVINLPKDVLDTVIMPFTWFGGGKKKSNAEGNSPSQEGTQ